MIVSGEEDEEASLPLLEEAIVYSFGSLQSSVNCNR